MIDQQNMATRDPIKTGYIRNLIDYCIVGVFKVPILVRPFWVIL